MKLATTTGDFGRYLPNHLDRLKAVADAGFKYIDFSFYTEMRWDSVFMKDGWKDYTEKLKACADELGLTFVQSHAPGGNPLVKDANYDILLASTIRSIEVCGLLGIDNTVVHPGWDGMMSLEEYCERNMEFWRKLYPAAEENGVYLLVENTTHANMGTIHQNLFTGKDMMTFVEASGHPLVACCWDTGHANCEGRQYKDILDMGDKLKAIHFNDNRGERDEHITPFMGTLCVDEVMNALIDSGFKGPLTMECDSTFRPFKYWLGNRHDFSEKKVVTEASLEMKKKAEELLYVTGKYILESYNLWEE